MTIDDTDPPVRMTIEQVIGRQIQELRLKLDPPAPQAEVGRRLGQYLAKPWPRQSVSHAEAGNRAFTAVELVAFSSVFGVPIAELLKPPPGVRVTFPSGEAWDSTAASKEADGDLREVARGIDELERAAAYLRNQHELTKTNVHMEEIIINHVDQAYTALIHALTSAKDGQ